MAKVRISSAAVFEREFICELIGISLKCASDCGIVQVRGTEVRGLGGIGAQKIGLSGAREFGCSGGQGHWGSEVRGLRRSGVLWNVKDVVDWPEIKSNTFSNHIEHERFQKSRSPNRAQRNSVASFQSPHHPLGDLRVVAS